MNKEDGYVHIRLAIFFSICNTAGIIIGIQQSVRNVVLQRQHRKVRERSEEK